VRTLSAAVLAALAFVLFPVAASADPQPPPSYVDAVDRAYALIQFADPADTGPAAAAYAVLYDGTGVSQPEILDDLRAKPPNYDGARQRLRALLAELDDPLGAPDPALAAQKLHDVMAMHRYDALHRPPSLFDRLGQWVQDRIAQLLRFLFGRGGQSIPDWWFYGIGILTLVVVAVVVFRAARGRFTSSIALVPDRPRAPADHFTEADRLARAGDRVGAIRELCAGVAATIAGERSWEGSPLTVREIFRRAPDHARLDQLLAPFEAAVYGGKPVDADTYDRAAAVADAYRRPRPAQEAA
jgi:hypothetical protein